MAKSKNKRYINLEEKEYRKRKRDTDRINELKPLIEKAHKVLRHIKAENNKPNKQPHEKTE